MTRNAVIRYTLFQRSLRDKFEELLDIKIEGDLSPVARYYLLERARWTI